jgi:hypothetical protein
MYRRERYDSAFDPCPRCDRMPRFGVSENLSKKINDLSRARQSLIEEMEAIMFYD